MMISRPRQRSSVANRIYTEGQSNALAKDVAHDLGYLLALALSTFVDLLVQLVIDADLQVRRRSTTTAERWTTPPGFALAACLTSEKPLDESVGRFDLSLSCLVSKVVFSEKSAVDAHRTGRQLNGIALRLHRLS